MSVRRIIARIKYLRVNVAKKLSGLLFEQGGNAENRLAAINRQMEKTLDDNFDHLFTAPGPTIALGYFEVDYLAPVPWSKSSSPTKRYQHSAKLPFLWGTAPNPSIEV